MRGDRRLELVSSVAGCHPSTVVAARRASNKIPRDFVEDKACSFIAHLVGIVLGRWCKTFPEDLGVSTELSVFDACSSVSPIYNGTSSPDDSENEPEGVLVHDPGHPSDLGAVLNAVGSTRFGDRWNEFVADALYAIDGSQESIGEWLNKRYFALHLSCYSKSRRSGPIYWQLGTGSSSYSIWIYYHRFTRDTFFKAIKEYLKPKLHHERQRLERLRTDAGAEPTRSQLKDIEDLEKFVAELTTMVEEVERIAPLWNPNLNDGAIINFAPLWRLVPQNKSWQKECKKVWAKLVKGDYDYDVMKRRNRTESPGGTITFNVFDVRSLTIESWTGTDDTGATSSDPSGGGAAGNNMKQITGLEYDSGNDAGNGNLTKQTEYVDASTTRLTTLTYDWRNRRTDIDGEVESYRKQTYDNLDRVIKTERYDTTSSGNLISRSETKFDNLGRIYQSIQYGVDPSTGTVGNSLTDNTWFDADGNVIKQQPAGSDLFTKTSYDSLGRSTTRYSGYDLDETSYADAGSVTGDTIMEQVESAYDDASNAIQSTTRNRYHNAAASQTGELKNPSETPNARVTYVASYPDALGRTVATANYGTNGGTALTRASTIPTRSDTVLVRSAQFDSSGNHEDSTDPSAVVTRFEYDAVPRETKRIMNYVTGSSSSGSGSVDTNVTVHTAYNADGNVKSLTADNAATGNQKTEYIYGTTLSDSEVASSLLKRKEIYPDSVDSSDVILFEYNRQSDTTKITDQGGTVHEFDYDKLGRQTHDRVTTLGSGVDGAVRRISTTYEVRGMKATVASWNNASVVSGNVVNEVEFTYNNFAQLTHDYQAHSGTVNVSTTPKVFSEIRIGVCAVPNRDRIE